MTTDIARREAVDQARDLLNQAARLLAEIAPSVIMLASDYGYRLVHPDSTVSYGEPR